QFAEKINQSSDVKLGNLAGGQYVDKNKYDDISRQLEVANANLADYDPEWKSKLEQAQADGEKKLNDYKFDQSVEKAIADSGAADVFSVKANIDMSTVAPGEDGAISGLSEQLEKLKSEKSFLFKSEAPEPTLNLGGSTKGAIRKDNMDAVKRAMGLN
ncbi:MAG: phage scaffolding protein, partial [Ruminococcus sp.]